MDDLAKRLRAANPFAKTPLSPEAQQTLDDIMAGRRIPRSTEDAASARPRRTVLPLIAMSSFALVTLVVAAVVVLRPQAAFAATPYPLPLNATSATVQSLYDDLKKEVPMTSGSTSRRGATWDGWYVQLDADRPAATFIQPQTTTIAWQPDLSATSTITAGAPLRPDGAAIEPLPADAPVPGSAIAKLTFAPGEFITPFLDAPPGNEAGMRAYLDTYLAEGWPTDTTPTAGDYLDAVSYLMQFWTLDADAQRAALAVILSAPGVNVAGATTDRDGRSGLVLQFEPTEADPSHTAQLVIDTDSWRLLALEHLSVDGIPEFKIPAGSVTDYTLWR